MRCKVGCRRDGGCERATALAEAKAATGRRGGGGGGGGGNKEGADKGSGGGRGRAVWSDDIDWEWRGAADGNNKDGVDGADEAEEVAG